MPTEAPGTTSQADDLAAPESRNAQIVVIGGGLSGLAAAIRFRREGWHDFLVLERAKDLGGTWRDNTYPGAACDVPSHVYSYSFAPNPNWRRSFSAQREIQDYILGVARRNRVHDHLVSDCEVLSARWVRSAARWRIETTRGVFTSRVLVGAWGALCEPSLPGIEGIERFRGEVFHSARWNHDADLTGRKVAVIGTGASAIQIVPAIAEQVRELKVFQRTAPWVLPRLERRYSTVERLACRYVPLYQRLVRSGIYWAHEAQAIGLAKVPALLKPVEVLARAKLRREVRDPEVRRSLTPDYRLGCKRILLSNTYHRAFNRDNVRLVTEKVTEVRENSLVTADGSVHEADALVLATGFHDTDSPTYRTIFGKDGRSLDEVFDEVGLQCYKGTAIVGFPNLFLLVGPNTGLGHNSMIFMIESQINYLASALETMRREGIHSLEVRAQAQEAFSRMLRRRLSGSIWNIGGCVSWYLDKHGDNSTIWPGFSFEFRRITRKFDVAAYDVSTGVPAGEG